MLKKRCAAFRTLFNVWIASENIIIVLIIKIMILIRWLPTIFLIMVQPWMFLGFLIHLCWFFFRCILFTNCYGPADVCLLKFGVWDMFGAVDKNLAVTSMTSFWRLCSLLWGFFLLLSTVLVDHFVHVNFFGNFNLKLSLISNVAFLNLIFIFIKKMKHIV